MNSFQVTIYCIVISGNTLRSLLNFEWAHKKLQRAQHRAVTQMVSNEDVSGFPLTSADQVPMALNI